MKKSFLAVLGIAMTGFATAGEAGSLADIAVVDRNNGQRLPTYYHQGQYWIAGMPGNKYAVAVNNRSGQRVMTVVSVDGVNVVTGETAAPEQNGYVLDRGMRYEITGWRKNLGEVAAFVFTALPESYAARTDRPGNVGVIGVAVFREWTAPRTAARIPPQSSSRADSVSGAVSAESNRKEGPEVAAQSALGESSRALRDDRLGTGHGDREDSRVGYTSFRRAGDRPNETLTIYYDSHANLVARGIIPSRPRTSPNPFPAGMHFVPDPKG